MLVSLHLIPPGTTTLDGRFEFWFCMWESWNLERFAQDQSTRGFRGKIKSCDSSHFRVHNPYTKPTTPAFTRVQGCVGKKKDQSDRGLTWMRGIFSSVSFFFFLRLLQNVYSWLMNAKFKLYRDENILEEILGWALGPWQWRQSNNNTLLLLPGVSVLPKSSNGLFQQLSALER